MQPSIDRKSAIFWRILATVSFFGMILVNALANALPINGLTTGEVSDLYPNLFTPAGVTFSIWSVIYLMLAGFIVQSWRQIDDDNITRLLPAFVTSCGLNVSWILVWHHLLPAVSVVIMLLLLLTLATLFLKIQQVVPRRNLNILFIVAPFSIYLAWICVATIANVSAWLTSLPADALSSMPQMWTVVMMVVATVIAIWIFLKYQSPEFMAVVFWALLGIFLRWRGSEYNLVQAGSIILMVLLLAITLITLVRKPVRN
jgi:translocator protein